MNIDTISSFEATNTTVSEESNIHLESKETQYYGRKFLELNPLKKMEGFGKYESIAEAIEHIAITVL